MNRSGLRILLLDDEPFMLRLLAQMLAGLGFDSVLSCDNGASALGWVDDPVGAPNLILLDLNMPQMDGIEFVRKLVESDLPDLEVVSFAELLPEVSLRPLAKASMAD